MYTKRIGTLCSLSEPAEVFADVGCDHGYCTEYMLGNSLCKKAVFSDISKGSLAKAERLLAGYISSGRAIGVLGDGFCGLPRADEVLIAGMGGHEIVGILSHPLYGYLPEKFVFQPMHNADCLRRYLVGAGAFLERDFTFRDGKFYDVVKGRRLKAGEAAQAYTPEEYEFGRENLRERPADFLERTRRRLAAVEEYLKEERLGEESRAQLLERKKRLEGVLGDETE